MVQSRRVLSSDDGRRRPVNRRRPHPAAAGWMNGAGHSLSSISPKPTRPGAKHARAWRQVGGVLADGGPDGHHRQVLRPTWLRRNRLATEVRAGPRQGVCQGLRGLRRALVRRRLRCGRRARRPPRPRTFRGPGSPDLDRLDAIGARPDPRAASRRMRAARAGGASPR